MYFIGIDIGTQGTRVVIVVDEERNIIAKQSSKIDDLLSATNNSDLFEQNPASTIGTIISGKRYKYSNKIIVGGDVRLSTS